MASNPVFSRIERETERGYAGFGDRGSQPPPPASGWPGNGQMTDRQLQELYERPAASAVQTGRLTLDDVVMKTAGLFTLMLVFAAVGWVLTPQVGPVLLLGGIALTLVLGFAIALKKTISVPLIVVYAVVEGLLVGSISVIYANRYEGIVTQAVLATLSVFAGMLLAYKVGLIKVTARFRRMVTMAIFGYMIFALVNLGYALITHSAFGIGGTSPLGIGISIFAVGLASFSLALDFDAIERAIAAGAPQRYSWLLAHGLIVTLVWLYLEILRLLGRARSN
jgi:uncharacterized YccA/Bax inhibitor family protein